MILARGLGLLRIVTNFLHAYDVVGNSLIVVVGADENENGWIGEGWCHMRRPCVHSSAEPQQLWPSMPPSASRPLRGG